MTISRAFSIIAVLTLCACSGLKDTSATISEDSTAALQGMMTGSFSSAEQAANDSDYYDISLHMYSIWPERKGTYLYVEQALTSMPDKPYRQRIYKLVELKNGLLGSELYLLDHDSLYVGKWRSPEFFDQYGKEIMTQKKGCTVTLYPENDGKGWVYSGETNDKDCESTMRGASYATAKVVIRQDMVSSWDQGWNAQDEQVWGATKSGYVFKGLKGE